MVIPQVFITATDSQVRSVIILAGWSVTVIFNGMKCHSFLITDSPVLSHGIIHCAVQISSNF